MVERAVRAVEAAVVPGRRTPLRVERGRFAGSEPRRWHVACRAEGGAWRVYVIRFEERANAERLRQRVTGRDINPALWKEVPA